MISTYGQLLTAINDHMHRSDLPGATFVALAEERFNRRLRVRQMETALASTPIVANKIAIPADTVAVRKMWVDGYESCPLRSQSLDAVMSNGTTGIPTMYAWGASDFTFDGTGSVSGVLYTKVPNLETLTTSWLLDLSPSAYLFAALAEAYAYIENPSSAAMWGGRADGVLDELSGNDARDTHSGQLTSRKG